MALPVERVFFALLSLQEFTQTTMRTMNAPPVAGEGWQLRLQIIPLLIFGLSQNILVQAKLACTSTEFCETTLRKGSQCVNGFCDNPFQYGCLQSQMEGFTKLRVCNSEDPEDAASRGLCRDASTMNYPEIRIMSQNWESPFFEVSIYNMLKELHSFIFLCILLIFLSCC